MQCEHQTNIANILIKLINYKEINYTFLTSWSLVAEIILPYFGFVKALHSKDPLCCLLYANDFNIHWLYSSQLVII